MTNPDKQIISALAITILIHIGILAISIFIPLLSYLIVALNLIVGLSVLSYWAQKEIRSKQHFIEFRGIAVLSFEVVVIVTAVYSIIEFHFISWLSIAYLIIEVIHFFFLVIFFIFMLTFKIKKLFWLFG